MSQPKKVTTYGYKPIELENYQRDEQSKLDKKLVTAHRTGDYSDISETVTKEQGTDIAKPDLEATTPAVSAVLKAIYRSGATATPRNLSKDVQTITDLFNDTKQEAAGGTTQQTND